jgi:Fe-S-cluster containining protein
MNKEQSDAVRFVRVMNKAVQQVEFMESSSCDCNDCKSLCKRNPGIGTPEEIEAINKAGYGHKLALTNNYAFVWLGMPMIEMVTPRMTEHGCAFLDELGHCELHNTGLKPMECRLARVGLQQHMTLAVPIYVARTWIEDEKLLATHPMLNPEHPIFKS